MLLNEFLVPEQISYFFTRVKRTHEENGKTRITLFVRLTKEYTRMSRTKKKHRSESVWADISEIDAHEAAESITATPEHAYKYAVSEQVFQELVLLAGTAPEDLFHTTPKYVTYAVSKSS